MAAISRSRRSTSGIALIVAGALFLLAVLLPLVSVSLPWLVLLADAAMVVALVILALGAVNNTVAKVSLFAGAVGWAVLALAGLGLVLPAPLPAIAALVAGVGGLIGAIVLYVGKEITNRAAVIFIVATALGLLYLLGAIGTLALGTLGTVVTVLFGAALIVAGVYFRRTEGRR
ncbi:MAG: hypothetical protein KF761_12590 [Salinibacterium sp.]|nr:hypothetical protein [Salinibacterium sp.]